EQLGDDRGYTQLDQEKIESEVLTNTEKEQLVKTRIGHSNFRKDLVKRECKCKLCGVTDKHFLIASHIKPWSKSSSEERLDLDNGFLLCPNHDALFDKGFITFDENGEIIISKHLDEETKVFLNIRNGIQIKVGEGQRKYLEWHKNEEF